METATPERFVDAVAAGEFLALSPKRVQVLARSGRIPAYPLSKGRRRTFRFRLSEIATALSRSAEQEQLVAENADPSYASKSRKRVARGALRRDEVSAG
jgi:hypothetical protein